MTDHVHVDGVGLAVDCVRDAIVSRAKLEEAVKVRCKHFCRCFVKVVGEPGEAGPDSLRLSLTDSTEVPRGTGLEDDFVLHRVRPSSRATSAKGMPGPGDAN